MTPRALPLAATLALLAGGPAAAHHGEGGPHPAPQAAQHRHAPPRPGAGAAVAREVKALSPAEIADLRAGRGMGLALPAELNGYPGPMHVLELAEPLHLSPAQRHHIAELVEAMRTEVRPLGEQVIAAEGALDRLFATGRATPATVTEASGAAGAARASLRAAHLRYHLAAREALTAEQISRYEELRGHTAARR